MSTHAAKEEAADAARSAHSANVMLTATICGNLFALACLAVLGQRLGMVHEYSFGEMQPGEEWFEAVRQSLPPLVFALLLHLGASLVWSLWRWWRAVIQARDEAEEAPHMSTHAAPTPKVVKR